jgi:RimJ/RimL family protein N-acetyltransferase
LETSRLRLRGHTVNDLPACVALWSDPNVTKFITGRPSTTQQTWSRVLAYTGHWALMGFGYWAIEERASGDFVGELGFADFKREVSPHMTGVPELGFALASHVHGRGYASEAVRAALAWSDAHLRARTVCIVTADNRPSLHIVLKNGYGVLEKLTYNEQDVVLLARESTGR